MRKISLNPRIGPNGSSTIDFVNDWIVVKDNNGLQEFKADRFDFTFKNYSVQQIEAISKVNNVLDQNRQPRMTEEEIEHLLYPFGKEVKINTTDLQALAGFEVRKEVVQK